MDTPPATSRYKNHRFPGEIVSHAVWLYFRLCLSFREVEELLFERGVIVSYEAICQWCRKFGQPYATQLRCRRLRLGDQWHLDEVCLTIKGHRHYLGRAVDQDGNVLEILVQRRRDKQAAKKFFRKLRKGLTYIPRVLITDKLQSYGAAKREILPGVEPRPQRSLNNRAENSHQPTRQAHEYDTYERLRSLSVVTLELLAGLRSKMSVSTPSPIVRNMVVHECASSEGIFIPPSDLPLQPLIRAGPHPEPRSQGKRRYRNRWCSRLGLPPRRSRTTERRYNR